MHPSFIFTSESTLHLHPYAWHSRSAHKFSFEVSQRTLNLFSQEIQYAYTTLSPRPLMFQRLCLALIGLWTPWLTGAGAGTAGATAGMTFWGNRLACQTSLLCLEPVGGTHAVLLKCISTNICVLPPLTLEFSYLSFIVLFSYLWIQLLCLISDSGPQETSSGIICSFFFSCTVFFFAICLLVLIQLGV